jgi:hypothetical protein
MNDGLQAFSFTADKFSFNETRYVNSLIDYGFFIENSRRVMRSKIDPNNFLSMCTSENTGIITLNDGMVHDLTYVVKDAGGNTSKLDFKVFMENNKTGPAYAVSGPPGKGAYFYYDRPNYYETEEMELEVPTGALYDSFHFGYDTLMPNEDGLSKIHRVHVPTTPLHDYCTLKIKPFRAIPDGMEEKCLIVRIDEEGEMSSAGGEYENGFVEARIRDFGDYMVTLDTVAPEITALKNASLKNIAGKTRVGFKIKDELSGIREYRGELNGSWILMEYDAKNDLLYYDIDERLNKGVVNSFTLLVTDMKGNESEYNTGWTR